MCMIDSAEYRVDIVYLISLLFIITSVYYLFRIDQSAL